MDVSKTPQSATQVCTHERRPGTTVCLHCRHAERIAAGERRKKLMWRGAAGAVVLVVIGVTGAMSATAIRGRLATRNIIGQPVLLASSDSAKDSTASAPTAPVAPVAAQQGNAPPTPVATPVPAPVAHGRAPLSPAIPQGETMLADSVLANRVDSTVTLSFDRPMLRTRIPEKFEHFLRVTLTEVYGRAVDSALVKIPEGALAAQGNLLNDLPTRGIHIPVNDGWKLSIYPELRPGQDGPLVVRYHVAVVAKD